MYIVKTPIKILSAGLDFSPGQRISGVIGGVITEQLLVSWLADGAIAKIDEAPKPVKLPALEDVPGMTAEIEHDLHALGFHSVIDLAQADNIALQAIKGVGLKKADALIKAAKGLP